MTGLDGPPDIDVEELSQSNMVDKLSKEETPRFALKEQDVLAIWPQIWNRVVARTRSRNVMMESLDLECDEVWLPKKVGPREEGPSAQEEAQLVQWHAKECLSRAAVRTRPEIIAYGNDCFIFGCSSCLLVGSHNFVWAEGCLDVCVRGYGNVIVSKEVHVLSWEKTSARKRNTLSFASRKEESPPPSPSKQVRLLEPQVPNVVYAKTAKLECRDDRQRDILAGSACPPELREFALLCEEEFSIE